MRYHHKSKPPLPPPPPPKPQASSLGKHVRQRHTDTVLPSLGLALLSHAHPLASSPPLASPSPLLPAQADQRLGVLDAPKQAFPAAPLPRARSAPPCARPCARSDVVSLECRTLKKLRQRKRKFKSRQVTTRLLRMRVWVQCFPRYRVFALRLPPGNDVHYGGGGGMHDSGAATRY